MIRAGEPNDYASEILFYLPQEADPSLPKLLHTFVLGEVQIRLNPGDAWTDVTPVSGASSAIVERGGGWYAIRLTALQRASSRTIAYQAVCALAQPDRGTEVVGDLSGDIAENGAGLIPFYLPDATDPIFGTPISGHAFTLGEVVICLPDDVFGNVLVANIVERGGGLYEVVVPASQTTKRGKAIVVATVTGAQRSSVYRTILGTGALVTPTAPTLPNLADVADADQVGGDLALRWSNATGNADVYLVASDVDFDLATDRGLLTAVMLSLFTDRRAEDDDVPPSGDPTDRRGWLGDEFLDVEGDRYGSRLWLLDRGKNTNDTRLRAKEYALEALAWMIEDKVVASIEVVVESITANGIAMQIQLMRPGRDAVTFRFSDTWDHLQESTR